MSKKNVNIPVKKNDIYTGVVEDLTYEGFGVVKISGYPVFVENALPDEEISFKVVKTGKSFSFGRLMDIETESPERVEGRGKAYTQTGTMPLQHMSYPAQLKFKRQQVENNFQRTANLTDLPVYETIGMESPYGYRNKAQIPVREIDGKLETGFYRRRSHDLIPLEDFVIQDPKIDKAIIAVRNLLREYDIKAYDEVEHKGTIRHIIVRRGYYTQQLMIVLVTNGWDLPHADDIVERLTAQLPKIVSIVQNNNPKKTNVILGLESRVLYGEDYYQDQLFDFVFNISHQSFYQINPTQTEKLYQTALDFAELDGDEFVVDAYCGIGTLTLTLAQKAKQVHGIEIVAPAIENAKKNAELNNVENVSFEVGAAEKVLTNWAEEGQEIDVLVVDPPRKGLAEDFLKAVVEISPKRMVYVSCNPATLARDVKYLMENGYKAIKNQPVDMFPHTTHVESVTLLVKE